MPGVAPGDHSSTSGFMQDTHANRPAASASNNGLFFLETDTNGGTWFQSNGTTWVQLTPGVTAIAIPGLTGSTAGLRFVGATASGAPASGAHLVGDVSFDLTGAIFLCSAPGTPGTWVQGGGGLTTANAKLGSDVSMTTANQYYDIVSLSLAAGTWDISGVVAVRNTAGADFMGAKLWDGTTAYASGETTTVATSYPGQIVIPRTIITLGSTTTIKISAYANAGVAGVALAALVHNGAGNNATQLTATKTA